MTKKIKTDELKKLKEKLGSNIEIIKPNNPRISLHALCNSTKINKKISTKIVRV